MPIPDILTRQHVEAAIAHLKQNGIPHHADSTRYDLIDPAGNRWPPKVVLQLAVEFASGVPFPRGGFSGGDETNSRLEALGFVVAPKPGVVVSTLTLKDIRPGMAINNDDLVHAFAVGNAGGMRWSSTHGCLVIIVDHTKVLYDDRWIKDILYYTGMGTRGDQTLKGQNLRLYQQPTTGIDVYLFEVIEPNQYVYAGLVDVCGSVETEEQPDDDGSQRKVFVFPLKLTEGSRPVPRAEQLEKIRTNRQRHIRKRTLDEL
jgi:hypothetical protein